MKLFEIRTPMKGKKMEAKILALAPRALPAFKSRVIDMFVRNYYHVLELLGEGVGGEEGEGQEGKEIKGGH